MSDLLRGAIRASFLVVLFVGGLLLTSCDLSSTGGTIILNANSSVPPTVQYRFAYTQNDATEGGQVDVVSTIESDDLDDVLAPYGVVSRDQVVSAQVDSVQVDPVSTTSLSSADIHLGTDADGPQIASVTFPSGGEEAVVDASRTPVTGAVKAGASKTFGRFRVEDPSSIPGGGNAMRADVYFQIEAE
ncbi:MAG: hypothetical protein BRD27_04280 [Bacteroidetes bacterium QH_10_64_19]|nr:MAG: hypothetical protein BRD27_04280 [Bacteroidetes bacterium QH_10_64_19]